MFESPIEIAVNTNRLFMEGLHCVLEFEFNNLSDEDVFDIELHLGGRLLDKREKRNLTLHNSSSKKRSISFHLPTRETNGIGSAGDATFQLDILVNSMEEGRHRFTGEFTLMVLAYAKNLRDVNVNINKLVEQTGEKTGMGAINEIDLSNLVNVGNDVSVNDIITKTRDARFVSIDLEYSGEVKTPAKPIVTRDVEPLLRCAIEDRKTSAKLLVLSCETIVLGKHRQKADIVTWVMPRTEKTDYESRKISRKQCQLKRAVDGLYLEQLSSVNPTRVNGETVDHTKKLNPDETSEVLLPAGLQLTLSPLPHVAAPAFDAWKEASDPIHRHVHTWAQRTGIGGLLIQRRDGLATIEHYLWLFSVVSLPSFYESGEHRRGPSSVGVMATPHLHLCPLNKRKQPKVCDVEVGSESAVPLTVGDGINYSDSAWSVNEWVQHLDEQVV